MTKAEMALAKATASLKFRTRLYKKFLDEQEVRLGKPASTVLESAAKKDGLSQCRNTNRQTIKPI